MAEDKVGVYLYTDKLGRTYVKGLHETRRALMAMGMERNEFEKLIKESAMITARFATQAAPTRTGKLAMSIRGQASKKYTTAGVTKRAFGGVVLGRTPYARAVSYGHRYVAGQQAKSTIGTWKPRVWRQTKNTQPNRYMVQSRDRAKPFIVNFWTKRLDKWIEQKGFRARGF